MSEKASNYNFAKAVPCPYSRKIKAGSKGTFKQIKHNISAIAKYMKYLTLGPPLGHAYFMQHGTCNGDSVPDCRNKPRYLYVRTVPTGKLPCSSKNTGLKGLIPGAMETTLAVNPLEPISALVDKNKRFKNKCIKRKLPVYRLNQGGKTWETRCSPTFPYLNSKGNPSTGECPADILERFQNESVQDIIFSQQPPIQVYQIIFWMILVVGLILITYSSRNFVSK